MLVRLQDCISATHAQLFWHHVSLLVGFVRLHSSCLLIPQSHTITQQLQLKGADQPLPVSQHLSIQHMQPAVIDSSASSEADQTLHHQDRKSARSDPEQSMELVADPPQHPSQGVNSSNDQDASTAPVQLNDAPRAPLLSKYPHLEKALRSAAEQAAYAPQRVTLFNEFAAEELRTLSRLLPAGGLASGVDGNNQQQVSSPQDGKGAYHQDSPQEETAGEPSLAEAQVNTQMHRGWGGEQEAASEEAAQMAQPADSSPQASKSR